MKSTESLPPSSSTKLLQQLIGKRITSLTRYSWWPRDEVAGECGVEDSSAFSLTYGPLCITFNDGTAIGIAEQPDIYSIVLWLDRCGNTAIQHPTLDEDTDLFPINANDQQFSKRIYSELEGATLSHLTILKPRSMTARMKTRPCEIGLCFYFNGSKKLIAAIGLHKEGGDFAVITPEQIPAPLLAETIELPLPDLPA